jgi:hypothetical protein
MAEWLKFWLSGQTKKRQAQREYLFKNASTRLDNDRHVVRELRELNRHADTLNTWVVGLSAGAIGLMVTGFTKVSNIPRCKLLLYSFRF